MKQRGSYAEGSHAGESANHVTSPEPTECGHKCKPRCLNCELNNSLSPWTDEMIFMEPLGPKPREGGSVYDEMLNTDL